jgi:C4-dicarboxylate-binding protein DctP
MKKYNFLFLLLIFFVISSYTVLSAPTPDNPITLKVGHCFPAGEYSGHVACVKLSEYIEQETEGAIKIDVYPQSQLGGERTMFEQILLGTIDMGPISVNIDATVIPELYSFSLPFAFPNEDVFWDAINNYGLREKIEDIYWEKGNIKLISLFSANFRGLQNTKREIRSPEDIKGLKMRVMEGAIFTDIFQAMGASTATIPMPELYTALQQGIVDGEDCNIYFANLSKLTEIQKYSTQYNAILSVNPLIMSGLTWQKLSPEQQKLFMDYGREIEKYTMEMNLKELEIGQNVFVEEMNGNLIKNSDLTVEERNKFRASVEPVWQKYKTVIGEDFYNYFRALTEEVSEAHGF